MTNIAFYIIIGVVILALLLAVFYFMRRSKHEHDERMQFVSKIDQEKADAKATRKRRYITPKLKAQILERDDYTCQICGISKGYLDSFVPGLGDYLLLEVDHIESVYNGGDGTNEDNLQVLCWRCNRKKGKNKTNSQVKDMITYGIKYLMKG